MDLGLAHGAGRDEVVERGAHAGDRAGVRELEVVIEHEELRRVRRAVRLGGELRAVAEIKEGELLLPHVEDLLLRHNNLKTCLDHAKQIPRGDVRIATIYSVGMYELAPFLKKFIRTYPEIHIHHQYRQADIIYDLML